jgi:hypothetical protein
MTLSWSLCRAWIMVKKGKLPGNLLVRLSWKYFAVSKIACIMKKNANFVKKKTKRAWDEIRN